MLSFKAIHETEKDVEVIFPELNPVGDSGASVSGHIELFDLIIFPIFRFKFFTLCGISRTPSCSGQSKPPGHI